MSQSPTALDTDWSGIDSSSESEYYRLLSSERRRLLLDVLEERPDSVDLATAAEAIADQETAAGGLPSETVEQISIALHHRHLPHLDDAGLIDYDPTAKTVDVHRERLPI